MKEPTASVAAWMKFFPADYLADTTHLNTEQHGAYTLLLFTYWRRGSLPDDDAVLARITGLEAQRWADHKPIIAAFFAVADGVWRHRRADRERVDATDRRQRAVERSQVANEARARKREEEQRESPENTDKDTLEASSKDTDKDAEIGHRQGHRISISISIRYIRGGTLCERASRPEEAPAPG